MGGTTGGAAQVAGIRGCVGSRARSLIFHLPVQGDAIQQPELRFPIPQSSPRSIIGSVPTVHQHGRRLRHPSGENPLPAPADTKNFQHLRRLRRQHCEVDEFLCSECFDGTFDLWMSLFSSIMKSSLTSHLGLKKYVLKILVIVYRDMAVYAAKKMKKSNGVQELCNVWEFSYRFLAVYLLAQVWGRK